MSTGDDKILRGNFFTGQGKIDIFFITGQGNLKNVLWGGETGKICGEWVKIEFE